MRHEPLAISSGILGLAIILTLNGIGQAQQNPSGQLPVTSVSDPYLFLIRDPVVHEDLGLSERQLRAVAELNDELAGPLWSMRNKSAANIQETMQTATATAKNRLTSILSREQQQRLDQITMWTLGTKAFLGDALPKELGLAEDQRDKIRETVSKTQDAIGELSQQLQSGQSRESLNDKARELRISEQKAILAVLSPKQQRQWVALLGRRIEVSKLGYVKFKAPDLHAAGGWINTQPLSLQQLKGKVVALHFYAFA